MEIAEKISLSQYSTLGIGGPARYFIAAADTETVIAAARWAKAERLPLFILGGGSNVLIADEGFAGLVLHITMRGIKEQFQDGKLLVTAAAGEDWDQFVAFTIANNWSGLECLSGIPGKIGATPIQNVGAYGQEVKETITTVSVYDRELDEILTLSNQQCRFSYRNSLFKTIAPDRYIVLNVTYQLQPDGKPSIRYPELQKYLSERRPLNEVSLAETREVVLAIRKKKSMVLDANDIDSHSVGSFFVNPVITKDQFQQLEIGLRANGELAIDEQLPNFPAPDNCVKLSAAWLIEQAGFQKGFQFGNVGISSKHALALINRNNGSARELRALAAQIERGVFEKFSIMLHHEPIYVGFS